MATMANLTDSQAESLANAFAESLPVFLNALAQTVATFLSEALTESLQGCL